MSHKPSSLSSYAFSSAAASFTVPLHDALPIWYHARRTRCRGGTLLTGPTPVKGKFRFGAAVKFTLDWGDRKSTRLNSSHLVISYAVFCFKKKITHYYSFC